MVLAAPAAEERAAWVDALQREAPRFVARLAARGVGCCPWYQVPFDDAGEPSLAVCEASSQLLRLLGAVDALGNAPLNFVTIFGQARQGKSTLLNGLAESEGLFAISHKDQTCTRGVDLSAKFVPVESFTMGSGGGGGGGGGGDGGGGGGLGARRSASSPATVAICACWLASICAVDSAR